MDTNKLIETKNIYNKKINELKKNLSEYTSKLEIINKQIQENCEHEWIVETQMYERNVYCCKCNLTDWDRCRF